MDKRQAERLTCAILGEGEKVMSDDGVSIFPRDLRDDITVRACFEDREYEGLKKRIVRILLEATAAEAVVHAQPVDGHDW